MGENFAVGETEDFTDGDGEAAMEGVLDTGFVLCTDERTVGCAECTIVGTGVVGLPVRVGERVEE